MQIKKLHNSKQVSSSSSKEKLYILGTVPRQRCSWNKQDSFILTQKTSEYFMVSITEMARSRVNSRTGPD